MTTRNPVKTIEEMRHETAQQTNGVLVDSFKLLVATIAAGGNCPAHRLARSVIVDELTMRNGDLRRALDAWELDLETADTADDVVLRHAKQMKRSSRYHHVSGSGSGVETE